MNGNVKASLILGKYKTKIFVHKPIWFLLPHPV